MHNSLDSKALVFPWPWGGFRFSISDSRRTCTATGKNKQTKTKLNKINKHLPGAGELSIHSEELDQLLQGLWCAHVCLEMET